jgi:hypothetical protein
LPGTTTSSLSRVRTRPRRSVVPLPSGTCWVRTPASARPSGCAASSASGTGGTPCARTSTSWEATSRRLPRRTRVLPRLRRMSPSETTWSVRQPGHERGYGRTPDDQGPPCCARGLAATGLGASTRATTMRTSGGAGRTGGCPPGRESVRDPRVGTLLRSTSAGRSSDLRKLLCFSNTAARRMSGGPQCWCEGQSVVVALLTRRRGWGRSRPAPARARRSPGRPGRAPSSRASDTTSSGSSARGWRSRGPLSCR